MAQQLERITHLRDASVTSRDITVVGIVADGTLRVGVSVRNPRDKNYDKHLGVTIARGRAMKRPLRVYALLQSQMSFGANSWEALFPIEKFNMALKEIKNHYKIKEKKNEHSDQEHQFQSPQSDGQDY